MQELNGAYFPRLDQDQLISYYKECLAHDKAEGILNEDQVNILEALLNKKFYDYDHNLDLVLDGKNFEQCCLILARL